MSLKLDRREMLKSAGLSVAAALQETGALRAQSSGVRPAVKALVFDTFGTIVDWRGSIIEEGTAWGQAKGLQIDWAHFADRWRSGYGPSMNKVRKGELPWTKLDDLHRMILDQLLDEFGIKGLTEDEKDHWNRVWHRLKPWPDSVAGLTRLKKKYLIAPLSNGNVALLTNMAKFAGLPWDLIMSAELFEHYKPDPETYLGAAKLLCLKPEQVMMVAAHNHDLKAAQKEGLKTAFVARPTEYGPLQKYDFEAKGDWDIVAKDFGGIADRLGC